MEDIPELSVAVHIIEQLSDAHRKLIISIIMLVASLLGSGDGEDIVYGFQAAMQRYHNNCDQGWPKFIDHIAERGSIWHSWAMMENVEPFGIAIAMTASWDVIHGFPVEKLVKSFSCTFNMCRMWFCKPPVASAEPVYSSTLATPCATRSGYQSLINEVRKGDVLRTLFATTTIDISLGGTPAPDFTLLKVQYLMQIMGVLCGAAKPDEDEQEEDDGDVDALQT
ncbi:hypothetical protein CFO_g90 [Ceratocystis platani]|uniref:Uncharacterized protein n=1 Tax=Ceratocystis fimbriata f. sp. platani TaxID=88771 RepID=A0A0F8D4D4_CERFI|nr:hypothetical protein CFO_g90 [Ceratocystis platani]